MPEDPSTRNPPATASTVEQLGQALDEWRARIDELIVQMDLATLDVREEVAKRVAVTENAYLAARSRMADLMRDAGGDVGSLRTQAEQLLADLRRAYEATMDVIRRGSDGA